MKSIKFKDCIKQALKASNLPPNEIKRMVSREREGRIAIHKETCQLIRTIADRNDTNVATVVWLAIYRLWRDLEYSYEEYLQAMFAPRIDSLAKEALFDIIETLQSTGIIDDLNVLDFLRLPVEEMRKRSKSLTQEQRKQFSTALIKHGLIKVTEDEE